MDLTKLAILLRNLLKELKNNLFRTEVTNLPEVQKVEITNHTEQRESVSVSNMIDNTPHLLEIVKSIKDKVIPCDDSASKKELLTELKKISKIKIPEHKNDDIVKTLDKIIKMLPNLKSEDKTPDFSEIVKTIKSLKFPETDLSAINDFVKQKEVPVLLNKKQLDKLASSLSVAISTGGGSSTSTGGGTDPVGLKNTSAVAINPATEDTLDAIKDTDGIKKITDALPAGTNLIGKVQEKGVGGTSTDGVVDLTSANTWYSIPATAITADHIIVISPAVANTGTIRWSFTNGGTPGVGNGVVAPGILTLRLAASQVVYFGSTVAGDDIEYTTKEIV